MAREGQAIVNLDIDTLIKNVDADGINDPSAPARFKVALSMLTGTGPDQVDRVFSSFGRTLVQSGTETLDVQDFTGLDAGAGAGNDQLGQAVSLAEIVLIALYVHPTSKTAASVGSLIVGNDGTTAAWNSMFNGDDTAALTILNGGFFVGGAPPAASWAVATTTNHLLLITESGAGAVTYDIMIAGRSA